MTRTFYKPLMKSGKGQFQVAVPKEIVEWLEANERDEIEFAAIAKTGRVIKKKQGIFRKVGTSHESPKAVKPQTLTPRDKIWIHTYSTGNEFLREQMEKDVFDNAGQEHLDFLLSQVKK